MNRFPKISIITPSFNQGYFLEETIQSVIGQQYPNLEYIIIDGGSTDNSIDILKKYDNKLSYWISEPDKGQAHAINKGIEKSTGDILAWLNSDDLYMPGTLHKISKKLNINNNEIICGNCIHFENSKKGLISQGSDIMALKNRYDLTDIDYINQPSTFWSRKTWETTGVLNEQFHYTFDWEWYIKANELKANFLFCEEAFALYRKHDNHKTGTGDEKRKEEIAEIYRIYNPNFFVYDLIRKSLNELHSNRATLIRRIYKIFGKNITDLRLIKRLHTKILKDYSDVSIEAMYLMAKS